MLFKVLLCFSLLYVVVSACASSYWINIATDQCVGARDNKYKEITYKGSDVFITAMKLVHRRGKVGCTRSHYSNWGCNDYYATNIIVTDTRNKRIYPAPSLVSLRAGGWYDLPGYGLHSPELVFSDPGFRYLYRGQKMRLWYGEDLHGYTEGDNHGYTCMDVYAYTANI